MKRGKTITVLLVIAVFFSLLSIAVSVSVDSGLDSEFDYSGKSVSDKNSGEVGLKVIDFKDIDNQAVGGQNGN